jgi:hypothetical protein
MRVPRWGPKPPAADRAEKDKPIPPGCHNCAHAVWDWSDCVNTINAGWPYRPMCSNHPDSSGRMQKVPIRGLCRNWRPKPAPPVRADPADPVGPTECKITLTKGLFATVDPQDYEWLNGFRWHATTSRGRTYAATVVNGKSISMHRMIMNPPPGIWAAHKDTERLNNHRDNLRLATPAQNRHNVSIGRTHRRIGSLLGPRRWSLASGSPLRRQ